eukprot:jgi/Chrpa1/9276/Chrysochromulina_OHIO_Genome00020591-RA
MPLPAVVAAALGIAAVLTPSMRNVRDCLKPTSDSHAWATDMKTGMRLEAAQVFELFYVFDWPGHNDTASEGSWFATLTWPDHVIITKIRGDRVHPVDDTLAARYPGLSEFALASMAYSVLGKPLASLKLQFGASAVAPVGQGWKADDAHAQGVTIVGKTTNVLYDDAIRDANVVPYPRVVCRTAAENAVLLTLPPPPPRPPPPWSRPPPPAEWASRNPSRQHQPPPRSPNPDGPQVPSQAPRPPARMVLLGTGSHNSADDAAVATATATETATLSERPATEQTAAIPPPRPLRWMAMLLAFSGVAVALVRRLHARLQQTDRHTPVLDWVAGIHGLGYYIDIGTEAGSVAAEFERMRAAISASSSDISSTIDDVDAPIMAAHASHMRALKEAEDQSEMLAKELAAWGRASSSLRHAAEQLEVRLTEQLRQLIDMQDDCCTVEARLACKSVIDRLHSVGKKLLCVSQEARLRDTKNLIKFMIKQMLPHVIVGRNDSETCKPRSEKKAASAPDCLSRYLERVDQRIQRAKPRRFRLPRPPLVRAWPVVREMALVMGGTVVLVLALPPAFDALPAPFDIRESAAAQARAALLGASVVGALFLFNFVAYALLYTHSWLRLLHTLVSFWVGVGLGVPLALFLLRAAQAAGVPLDAPTTAFLVWNLAVPGVLLAQWAPTRRRFQRTRIVYADSLAILFAWVLTCIPYQMMIAIIGLLAALDILLVGLPCCSPVQTIDKLYAARQKAGVEQMPGLSFDNVGAKDDLLLGLGDFIVFSVFAGHAARLGAAPLAAVAIGLLCGLGLLMVHVALRWPLRSLEPAIPLSVGFGALMLAGERLLLRPLADGVLALEGGWL